MTASLRTLNLALTSDFPTTTNHAVVARIQSSGRSPRVAWVAPSSSAGRARFPTAQAEFRAFGVDHLDYCDVDDEPNVTQLDLLDRYDVVYLAGGDPILFRESIRRTGLGERLREFMAAGSLVVGASGGAMQLTMNVSLFRLLSVPVDEVVANRKEFDGLCAVGYEILPHLNRHDASFLEKVQRYSELVSHDIVALGDGAALVHSDGESTCFGEGVRFTRGVRSTIEARPNKPLQPTRAAEPNGQREPAGSGPRG